MNMGFLLMRRQHLRALERRIARLEKEASTTTIQNDKCVVMMSTNGVPLLGGGEMKLTFLHHNSSELNRCTKQVFTYLSDRSFVKRITKTEETSCCVNYTVAFHNNLPYIEDGHDYLRERFKLVVMDGFYRTENLIEVGRTDL